MASRKTMQSLNVTLRAEYCTHLYQVISLPENLWHWNCRSTLRNIRVQEIEQWVRLMFLQNWPGFFPWYHIVTPALPGVIDLLLQLGCDHKTKLNQSIPKSLEKGGCVILRRPGIGVTLFLSPVPEGFKDLCVYEGKTQRREHLRKVTFFLFLYWEIH